MRKKLLAVFSMMMALGLSTAISGCITTGDSNSNNQSVQSESMGSSENVGSSESGENSGNTDYAT